MRPSLFILLILCTLPIRAEFSRAFLDEQPFATVVTADHVEIAYKDIGTPDQPAVVLIMGLGASHTLWGDAFVGGVRDAGYRVIMLDNRDVGASGKFDAWGEPTLWWQLLKNQLGFEVDAPYLLNDMANDTIAVMDALGIEQAHIVGASMGGMIAQIVAARYPDRSTSLVSIMSTTGAPHLPAASSDASSQIQKLANNDAEDDLTGRMRARGFFPASIPRQLMAIIKTGDRSAEVAAINVPTLVLHGADDTLLPPEHGKHTASLIKDSTFKIFEGMGHNIPEPVMPEVIDMMVEQFDSMRQSVDASPAAAMPDDASNLNPLPAR
ncbi:MAG: pimeloyl-ACP methyl ester carboxylesterase [Candidatus Azotimanducaceae bacterium]|jgi:pimeloyl-ACP methyl ester carboxylesterase